MYSPWVVEEEINRRYYEKLHEAEKLRCAKEYGIYYTTWLHESLLESLRDLLIAAGQKLKDRYQSIPAVLIFRGRDRQTTGIDSHFLG